MTMFVVLVVVLVVGFGLIAALASRPKASLTIRGGQVDLIDGSLPPGLERDLEDALKLSPGAEGGLRIFSRDDRLELKIEGLDPGTEQRIRNVVLLRRQDFD